jgi:hypothetical protein
VGCDADAAVALVLSEKAVEQSFAPRPPAPVAGAIDKTEAMQRVQLDVRTHARL